MTFEEKIERLRQSTCEMNCSKEFCIEDAIKCFSRQPDTSWDWLKSANMWLEKAAQYCWGFYRPEGWVEYSK